MLTAKHSEQLNRDRRSTCVNSNEFKEYLANLEKDLGAIKKSIKIAMRLLCAAHAKNGDAAGTFQSQSFEVFL